MVMLDFTGVKEAESFTLIKEGYLPTLITKANEGTTDKGVPVWLFEYTVQSGQYKGEVVKDTVYLSGKDNDVKKTKTLLSKILRMYSRILGVKLDGGKECNPVEFIGKHCMLKMKQAPGTKKEGYKLNYFCNIEFAGFFSISDYTGAMDDEMKHSDAYLSSLESPEEKETSSSSPAGF